MCGSLTREIGLIKQSHKIASRVSPPLGQEFEAPRRKSKFWCRSYPILLKIIQGPWQNWKTSEPKKDGHTCAKWWFFVITRGLRPRQWMCWWHPSSIFTENGIGSSLVNDSSCYTFLPLLKTKSISFLWLCKANSRKIPSHGIHFYQ